MNLVYLIIGVSGCGKSWVCRQLVDKFNYIAHDRCWKHPKAKPEEGLDPKWGPPGCESTHLETILSEVKSSKKPIVTEIPFGERKFRENLEKEGIKVTPIFIIEDPKVVSSRYYAREGKHLPKPALTRATSIIERANEWEAVKGTSAEILEYLKNIKGDEEDV